MKNVQIIDGAENAAYSIFQIDDAGFSEIFPGDGQDIELIEDYIGREGEARASEVLSMMWKSPIHKRDVKGIHGTLYYDYQQKGKYLPITKREIDRSAGQLNDAERELYSKLRLRHA
ncbi:MAG TPA: hypothetical protein VN678_00055 [Acidobacteriaceae bacterium]|nr:hypothetical protein [Acidobacteriaceae bacterium]